MPPPDHSISGIERVWNGERVVPVLTIADRSTAIPLARALVRGGIRVLEITFRTAAAADALRMIADSVPEAILGAGTVLDPRQAMRAAESGARFIVSPGFGADVAGASADASLPYLPGVATATEIMGALSLGFDRLKLFPAAQVGGVADVRFCPTGGVDRRSSLEYLALPQVFAVGGSWMVPPDAVAAGDWQRIEALARAATGGPETAFA
jgi:2-dehydro-3-deoxyphosphogluconate aldolase/(4S)-4-hydroxy-2-oxoglutarate aldolase